MGWIRHRGKKLYYGFVDVDGTSRTKLARGCTTEKQVKPLIAEAERRVQLGLPGIPQPSKKSLTVRQLAERFCGVGKALEGETVADAVTGKRRPAKDYEIGAMPKGGKPTKAKHYRAQFWSVLKCHVLDEIGDLEANKVSRADVLRVVDAMQGSKARTAQKVVRHLSRLYNWAIDRAVVSCANPAHKIETPKYAERNDFYTDAEVVALIAEAEKSAPDLYPIVVFAYYTGARKGEIAALRWSDVDLANGQAVLARSWQDDERKAGDRVTAHFSPKLLTLAKALYVKQGRPGGDALVFPAPNGLMRDKFDDWCLRELAELAKVRRFARPWHSFRHSHATALGAAGASLQVIQAALGQKTLEMARRYTKTAAVQVKAAVRSLPNVIQLAERRQRRQTG